MIPLSTTTVSVLRLSDGTDYDEPYGGAEPLNRTVVVAGLPAVIDHPNGNAQLAGGVQAIGEYQLVCDNADLSYLDLISDDGTGKVYRITWLIAYPGDHIEAGLRAVEGES